MTEEIEVEVEELKRRVSYLEQEVGDSYQAQRFRRRVEHMIGEDAEVSQSDFGMRAIGNVPVQNLPRLVKRVEETAGYMLTADAGDEEGMVKVTIHTE